MLQDDVWSYCTSLELLAPGTRVVVAVSGGSDSVALLRLLCSLRESCHLDVVCAHFNHQLRGAESDADEAFVRELAAHWTCPAKQDPTMWARTLPNTISASKKRPGNCGFAFFA